MYLLNSSKDDAYMIWDEKFKYGYLSSDREPCESGHCYDIYKVENAPIKIMLQELRIEKILSRPIDRVAKYRVHARGCQSQ